jgi:hypothetical protein
VLSSSRAGTRVDSEFIGETSVENADFRGQVLEIAPQNQQYAADTSFGISAREILNPLRRRPW